MATARARSAASSRLLVHRRLPRPCAASRTSVPLRPRNLDLELRHRDARPSSVPELALSCDPAAAVPSSFCVRPATTSLLWQPRLRPPPQPAVLLHLRHRADPHHLAGARVPGFPSRRARPRHHKLRAGEPRHHCRGRAARATTCRWTPAARSSSCAATCPCSQREDMKNIVFEAAVAAKANEREANILYIRGLAARPVLAVIGKQGRRPVDGHRHGQVPRRVHGA